MGIEIEMVSLLGAPHASLGKDSGTAYFPQKAFLLLALLLLAFNGRAPRPALAARLYEDADQAGASVNLRQLLARLRSRQQELDATLITADAATVQLAVDPGRFDVGRLLRHPPITDEGQLAEVCALYRGELLEGMEAGGESLDAWLAEQRLHLRERFADLVIDGARKVGGAAGERALERLIEIDPLREDSWRVLIRLRAERRGRHAALALYEDLARRLQTELGVSPEPETLAVLEDIRPAVEPDVRLVAANGLAAHAAQREQADQAQPAGVPKLSILMPRGDPGDELVALAGSLVEDVTIGLCRLRSLAVIAPHTAWQIGPDQMADAAARFGITYFVETRLAFAGPRCRLIFKLMRAADREIIWVNEQPFDADGMDGHYRAAAQSIVLSLADSVERAELARFEARKDPKAYHLYLGGQREMRSLELPSIRRARKAFKAAIERAPAFAPAHSGLARTLILEWQLLSRAEHDLIAEARRYAQQAIDIDPFDARGYRENGSAALYLGGLDESLDAFERAEMLAPHHSDILAEYADTLAHNSNFDIAYNRILTAIDLDPITPDRYLWYAGGILFFLQRYSEALGYLLRMRHSDPAYRLIAACWAMQGDREQAAKYVERALDAHPTFRVDDWIAAIPQRNAAHISQYADALRKAGFR